MHCSCQKDQPGPVVQCYSVRTGQNRTSQFSHCRQEPAPSIDLAFGSATAVFDSLQHGVAGPSFEAPETVKFNILTHGNIEPNLKNKITSKLQDKICLHKYQKASLFQAPPPSLPTYLPSGMPVPSPAQHIHINNFTANLNFPPHPSPPTAAPQPQPLPPQQQQQQQQQALQQQQQPQSLHSQPLPFTIGSHFPPGTQYVAPFPQAPASAQYQVFLPHPWVENSMFQPESFFAVCTDLTKS